MYFSSYLQFQENGGNWKRKVF